LSEAISIAEKNGRCRNAIEFHQKLAEHYQENGNEEQRERQLLLARDLACREGLTRELVHLHCELGEMYTKQAMFSLAEKEFLAALQLVEENKMPFDDGLRSGLRSLYRAMGQFSVAELYK